MAQEHGFKFTIKGEVFIPQKSKAGSDVVAAYNEAVEIRTRIQAELLDIPASIEIGEVIGMSRRAPDVKPVTKTEEPPLPLGDPAKPAEDGPTPAMDLRSRRKPGQPKPSGAAATTEK